MKNQDNIFWKNNPEKDQEFRKMFPILGGTIIASRIGITPCMAWHRAKILGLKLLTHGDPNRLCRKCLVRPPNKDKNFCQNCRWEMQKISNKKRRDQNPLKYKAIRLASSIKCSRKKLCENIDFGWKFLLELYEKQNGKCFYTGKDLTISFNSGKQADTAMSIDRINPLKGYSKDNIVLCGCRTNVSKSDMSQKEFYEMCKMVYFNLKDKKLDDNKKERWINPRFKRNSKK